MVSRISVEVKAWGELRHDILPSVTRNALLYCIEHLDFLSDLEWYLAGGTALALQVGHRRSVDLDFFLPRADFDATELERKLMASGEWTTSLRQQATMYGVLKDAKASFIAYPFFKPSQKRIRCGNVSLLIPNDIAAMKIVAISQRGRKRDFIDLYWYGQNREPLFETIQRAVKSYPGQEHNMNHILKSLVYFEDAEQDPMPKIFFKATWRGIKQYFRREVPRITKEFLGLT